MRAAATSSEIHLAFGACLADEYCAWREGDRVGRDIGCHHGVGSDIDIVSNPDGSDDNGPRAYGDFISDAGNAAVRPDRDIVVDPEIGTYFICQDGRILPVLNTKPWAYGGRGNIEFGGAP